MKYEDSKVKGISRKTLRALEQIAMDADYGLELRGGIEGRNNDSEDFPKSASTLSRRCLRKPTSSARPTE